MTLDVGVDGVLDVGVDVGGRDDDVGDDGVNVGVDVSDGLDMSG